ncbi:hypothetical protein PLICRDRAFT_87787 [Plicaturopsis crispa FD-325 SS-3]|nr:hypothetical protein PLICRDRAFT_87787 [Plicaturopsis crispa FD-325 SS-3]
MADTERPTTPPPRASTSTSLQLTPEQVKRVEINRMKAKAQQRQREQEASSSSSVNANNKRPLGVVPATSKSPTAPAKLKRDSRLGNYYDYDLSKMVNSKGGFLVEEGKEVDEERVRKEKQREMQRAQQNLQPPMFLDPALNPKCKECQSMDIDAMYKKVFGCIVCNKCKNEKPEKYSLLTKTECKEDYLLTDPELRDTELLPHLLKANPHASTFANMMLFLRLQVEEFAWKKWGSPEALDAEYEKRMAEKRKKKNRKFEQGLRDLRRKTREGVWQRRKDEEHKHVFGQVENGAQNSEEHHHISAALDVEQLETNLYRSKSLWLPVRSRGVFGGQVISQALVSATKSVSPQYGLHSVHCYFLLSGSPAVPIVYYVERLREGRSYTTRSVKAVQSGKVIFILMCSFHKPEPWQPSTQWAMPAGIPQPEECELEEVVYARRALKEGLDARLKSIFEEFSRERTTSPIAVKVAKEYAPDKEGKLSFMYWMRARDIPKYEPAFQKCILSYLSDLYFISVSAKALGLKRYGVGPEYQSMNSTLDHSIWFYKDDFDCGDWILYHIVSPRAGSGRGVVHGRVYTRTGDLVAITTQEGVVRAGIRGPKEPPAAKL